MTPLLRRAQGPRRATLSVDARPEDLPQVRTFIEDALRATPLGERARREVRLGVDEACANIIEHAYAGRAGTIGVEIVTDGQQVAITLNDNGKAFDPHAVGTPDLSRYVKTGKKGGFGLYLIHKTMDEVRHQRAGDENRLTLVKRFEPGPQGRGAKVLAWLQSRLRTRSLRLRFFIQASVLLVVLLSGAAAVLLGRAGAMARREVITSGVALATSLRAQALDLLLRPQAFGPKQTQLNAAAKAAVSRTQIASVIVTDTTDTIWAASDEDLLLSRFEPPANVLRVPPEADAKALADHATPIGDRYLIALPIAAPGPPGERVPDLGVLYVAVLESTIDLQAAAARRDILVLTLMIFGAGLAAVALLVRLIVKPIQRLTEGVRAIGTGQEQRLEEAGLEELDAIARAFNDVTRKFRDAQTSLVERERLQQEVEVAKSIQYSLLPRALPEMSGFEIGTMYQAAKEVGGDYYDFVHVGEETWGLAVADVSGKGVPASLVMMMIRTALRLEARGERAAAEVLDRVNRFVTADMKKGMFVTMFYVVLDSKERLISYASAGHNPMILYRAATDETYFLKPKGFPVGIDLPDSSLFARSIGVERVALEQGDLLVIYTDGITEAMDAQMRQFGTERLLQSIKRNAHLSPQDFCLQLERELAEFTGDTPQNDDITLVAIKERMSAPELMLEARERLLSRVEVDRVPVQQACDETGVSTSTYYRYRRLRETAGREGLRDRRKRPEPARLSNEQEKVLKDLIREDPDRGAKRLAEALSTASGQIIKVSRVTSSLRRLKLSRRAARREFAGVTASTPDPKARPDAVAAKAADPIPAAGPEEREPSATEGVGEEPVVAEAVGEEPTMAEGSELEPVAPSSVAIDGVGGRDDVIVQDENADRQEAPSESVRFLPLPKPRDPMESDEDELDLTGS
jgi:serine phosphatase RsbU (regulator of sigma subunit)/anti-sigma regulatory factor (Ser/Thr protein kinase)/transposase